MQMMINQKWKHLENNSNENRGRNASQPRAALKIRLFHTLGSLISRVCVFWLALFCVFFYFFLLCASHHSACWLIKISSIETTETSEGTRFFLIPLVQCQFFSFLFLVFVVVVVARVSQFVQYLDAFYRRLILWLLFLNSESRELCATLRMIHIYLLDWKKILKLFFDFFFFGFQILCCFFLFCFYYCYYYFITSFG